MKRTLQAALEESAATIDRLDAQLLVADVLGTDRTGLVTDRHRVLTETEDARIDLAVASRALGTPVAYLLGRREFYGRDFEVGPEVLIPRPETEHLVEAALERAPRGASVADLGTGSGAVAVTLACEREDLFVVATDLSEAALGQARSNALALGVAARIEFAQGPWYAPLAGRRFDLVVSNPPYVAAGDPHLGEGDLRFEPAAALADGSADGLDSIRALVAGAAAHLAPGGWLLFEHGYDQAEAVRALLESAGLGDLVSIPDLARIPRVAGGRVPGPL